MDYSDWYRAAGTALVVGVIGPLFWLGVGVLENWIRRGLNLLQVRFQRWRREQARARDRLLK